MKSILDSVRAGEPLATIPYLDVHCHFGAWAAIPVPDATDGARFLDEMDRYGCDMVWVSSSDPWPGSDLARHNDRVFELAAGHPDRILPYCVLSSLVGARAVQELIRCLTLGRCIGVKMHTYRQPEYTLRSDFLQPVLELLDDHRLVFLSHGFSSMDDLLWAATRYPGVTFVAGHFSPDVNDCGLRHDNIRDCVCGAHGFRQVESEVQRLGGSQTLLGGSDFGLLHLGFGLGAVAYAGISECDKANMLGWNALGVLQRTAWYGDVADRLRHYRR